MKIVIDTHVVVSGLLQPLGNPGRALSLVGTGALVPVYDARILAEYMEVCARPRLRLAASEVDRLLDEMRRRGEAIIDAPRVAFTLPDPDDQAFLDVAIAGRAQAILTGNRRDFPDACGVRILSPAELIQILAPLDA